MTKPVVSDFDVMVIGDSVSVIFTPTNSIYTFYRRAKTYDIARRMGVRHAGPSGDTKDYVADEVKDMAQRIAAEAGASVWSGNGLPRAFWGNPPQLN
jgi:hypothetical protein